MEGIKQMVSKLALYVAKGNRSFYPIIEQFLEKKEVVQDRCLYSRLLAMKLYCTLDIERIKASLKESDLEDVAKHLETHMLESAMIRSTLKWCNLLEETRLFCCGIAESEKYEIALLLKDYSSCRKIGVSIMQHSLSYVIMAVLMENRPDSQKVLIYLLSKAVCSSSLLLTAYQKGVPYIEIKKYMAALAKDIQLVFLCKALFISGEDVFDSMQRLCKYKWAGGDKHLFCASALLLHLDDWEVFSWLVQNRLDIKDDPVGEKAASIMQRNKSVNYKRYLMELSPSAETVLGFITSVETVVAAKSAISTLPIAEKAALKARVDPALGAALYAVVWNSISVVDGDNIQKYLGLSKVFVLGLVLSRGREEDLILALLLGRFLAKNDESFEVKLILTGVYRYLMMYDQMVASYIELDAQTIQLEKLTYIWHDLSIVLGRKEKALASAFKATRNELLQQINESVLKVVENEKYAQAISLLNLRQTLKESPAYAQITTGALVEHTSDVKEILLEQAQYVLEKLTSREKPADSILSTIKRGATSFDRSKVELLFRRSAEEAKRIVGSEVDVSVLKDLLLAQEEGLKVSSAYCG